MNQKTVGLSFYLKVKLRDIFLPFAGVQIIVVERLNSPLYTGLFGDTLDGLQAVANCADITDLVLSVYVVYASQTFVASYSLNVVWGNPSLAQSRYSCRPDTMVGVPYI